MRDEDREDGRQRLHSPLAIVFDIDGTLLSTGGAGTRSWAWAFDRLVGTPADIGRFSEAGMTDPQVARLTFRSVVGREATQRELATLLASYLERLPHEVERSQRYRVLPGVEMVLQLLCRNGFLVGVVTGALEAAAHIKLARGGLDHFFTFGGYGSDSPDRVELTQRAIERARAILGDPLDPSDVYAVGDTPNDIDAAVGAGVVAIGIASGRYDADALRAAGADVVLDSLEQPMPGLEWLWADHAGTIASASDDAGPEQL